MSKAFSILMLALVVLGFLISTTMNMYGDMEQLKTENQKLSRELTQLHSDNEAIAKEREAAQAENTDLSTKLNELQNVYRSENQARLKAESEAAIYKGMLAKMADNVQAASTSACIPTGPQVASSEKLSLLGVIPAGTGTLLTLATLSLVAIIINYYQRRKKR